MNNKFVIIIISIFLIFLYITKLTPSEFQARLNVRNSKKLRIKMPLDSVIIIMGKPNDTLTSYKNQGDTAFYYTVPFASSEGLYIVFDSLNYVNYIEYFE